MRRALSVVAVLVGIVVIAGLSVTRTYNRLVPLSQGVDAQWGQVENVYQRRADLVPNLVASVQGAADFERSTFIAVTEARAGVGRMTLNAENLPDDPGAFARFQEAQDQLSSALSRLLVVVERYPDLKATQNFQQLQAQLEGTENRITVERRRYNERAREYNTARLRFPTKLMAGIFGFGNKAYFRARPGAEQPPEVRFEFEPPGS
ncbi:MAG: LemA family protein [Actinomycetota bacterium]